METLTDVIQDSFSQYAGAVIQSRALVDVRDCVKPSARQIYYCLYTDGFTADKPFKKTLKAVGSSMRLYIHGDASCEGIIMRSGQPFFMRYPLVEVEGSYGNPCESGNWAASRYTSSRLSPLADYLVQDTDKHTIQEWIDNYDDTEQYPRVFSSLGYYNIVNGSTGIAIGLASSIPQFNITEVNNALITLLKNPDADFEEILCYPDFATGGTIINKDEVKESLRLGRGKACVIRAKIDYVSKERCLVVSELPYGVYTNTICTEVEKLAESDESLGIVGMNDLTGESVCIKIYLAPRLKADEVERLVELLYDKTSLQSSYGINMTMLDNGRYPKVFGWKDALLEHLEHERQTYIKMFTHQREQLQHRLDIVSALIRAAENIDATVKTIKESKSTREANKALQELLDIQEFQAKAILDMRLARLSKMEIDDLLKEKAKLEKEIDRLTKILESESLLKKEMIKRFQEVIKKFGDERRTRLENIHIAAAQSKKKVTPPQDVVLCLDKNGYMKSVPIAKYRSVAANVREVKSRTDEIVTLYSSLGRAYRIKTSAVKQCLNSDKGTALGSILSLAPTERIVDFTGRCESDILLVTTNGLVKKIKSSVLSGTTQNLRGMPIIKLKEGDEVFFVGCLDDFRAVVVESSMRTLTFDVSKLLETGKAASGRCGIKLDAADKVCGVTLLEDMPKTTQALGTKGVKKR